MQSAIREVFPEKNTGNFKVYKQRWVVLFLFVVMCINTMVHVSQYTIIADIIVEYYRVSYTAVNWSFTVYLLAYIIFGVPATWILEKCGLRTTILLSFGLTTIGSWMMVGSISPDRYWVVILGQSVIAISQVLIMPAPVKLAAVWFPSYQVSCACSVGLIGMEMGLAFGFLVPPLFVNAMLPHYDVGNILYTICIALSVLNSVVFVLLLLFFKNAPPTLPSPAQLHIEKCENLCKSVKNYVNNKTNACLVIAYGIAVGILLTVSTLLNPIVLNHYPKAYEDAGWIGLVMIFGGITGAIACGVTLDVYGKFKQTMVTLSILGIIAMACFTFAIDKGIHFVYAISYIFGFSTIGILVGGLELGLEVGYPIPEAIIAGVFTTSTQAFGIVFTYLYTYILETYGDYYASLTMLALFGIELNLISWLKFNLRRRSVEVVSTQNV